MSGTYYAQVTGHEARPALWGVYTTDPSLLWHLAWNTLPVLHFHHPLLLLIKIHVAWVPCQEIPPDLASYKPGLPSCGVSSSSELILVSDSSKMGLNHLCMSS